jgi:hypothetical protein
VLALHHAHALTDFVPGLFVALVLVEPHRHPLQQSTRDHDALSGRAMPQ